ncbi:hypothetical protein [Streptomyces olivaceoviridis]|uniref:hypothetical protein n=1 Tax=Streptomyces olivaceoviridis TaxID=1921 RepID=UPI0036F6B7F9
MPLHAGASRCRTPRRAALDRWTHPRWRENDQDRLHTHAVIAVGDPSRHDEGVGRAVLSRLCERALKRHFPPGTVLAECDLDPGRLIRLWDHTDLTVVPQAARTRPGNAGRIHRLEPDARRLDRPNAVERVEVDILRHRVAAARGADGVAMA